MEWNHEKIFSRGIISRIFVFVAKWNRIYGEGSIEKNCGNIGKDWNRLTIFYICKRMNEGGEFRKNIRRSIEILNDVFTRNKIF